MISIMKPKPKLQPLKIKIPTVEQITIKKTEYYNDIINDIEVNILKKPTRKILKGDTIKVFPDTIDDYRTIQKYLEDKDLEFFAMRTKNERPKKVLLRGIPPETPVETVKNELAKLNFEFNRVSQFKDFKTKAPPPPFSGGSFPHRKSSCHF